MTPFIIELANHLQQSVTIHAIITGVIMYLIVHGIIDIIHRITKKMTADYNHIVKAHIRNEHGLKLKHCVKGECINLHPRTFAQLAGVLPLLPEVQPSPKSD